jgi:hypothetical protein
MAKHHMKERIRRGDAEKARTAATICDLIDALKIDKGVKDERSSWPLIKARLESELAAKQAEIDRLMLEYCPDEMTPEQLAECRLLGLGDVGACPMLEELREKAT